MQRRTFTLSALAMSAAYSALAQSQDTYPDRPLKVIVPYPAGGVVDVQTRAMTQGLTTELGQAVVVESRAGANGNLAAEAVARAAADGYTLLVSAPFLINNPMQENALRWAPKDLIPVARFSMSPSFMCVPAASPAKTVRDYVEMAKRAKPVLQFGDPGAGTTQTMAVEILKSTTGIELEAVPYKGAPPLALDLINNAFSMSVLPSSVAFPHVKSGKLRALATTSSARSAQLPDVPTIAEAGYPDATVISWYGLHAPANTPAAVLRKLEAAIKAAIQKPEAQTRLVSAGGEAAFMGTDEFTRFIASDTQMWERINRTLRK
ncbi:Bug family tripartite tricarboxylate transporter substrate binding protein [Limnohabitans lacus]|uniref:Tripartite tricarboxylate transporter substrate binding protein n=1 Tax=Limnohabitans lacus TaxID=3045173 RepID=A0ABT6X312_9BURK|nr:tripartite tricarboxylate transporter substrate binding protein [Limnohabitans sp. HM2-2]MDI9232505.1 tripartite tricarboxylate transporter substrate binding protein [Limnohabitans sp. HM2-2]